MSSSHLRHCPKHRKPLPCTHCALTAKPINPTRCVGPAVDIAEPPTNAVEVAVKVVELSASKPLPVDPLPVTAKARRGRPRKHASDAEKQKAYRERKARDAQEKRRRDLTARIIKCHRGMLSDPFHQLGKSTTIVERVRISNREYMRKLRADLDAMTLEEIETYAENLFANADRKGKLPKESSGGEAPGARSRVENVLAADFTANKPKMGAGPDSYEREDWRIPIPTRNGQILLPKQKAVPVAMPNGGAAREALKEDALDVLAPEGRCTVCGLEGYQHMREAYRLGERTETYVGGLIELNESSPIPNFELVLDVEQQKLDGNKHFKEIRRVMRVLRKQQLDGVIPLPPGQETKLGRKLKKLGRKEAQMFAEEKRQQTEERASLENWGTQQKTRSWS